jgi:hypothetical protein
VTEPAQIELFRRSTALAPACSPALLDAAAPLTPGHFATSAGAPGLAGPASGGAPVTPLAPPPSATAAALARGFAVGGSQGGIFAPALPPAPAALHPMDARSLRDADAAAAALLSELLSQDVVRSGPFAGVPRDRLATPFLSATFRAGEAERRAA